MTYNVFGGTLNLAQSIDKPVVGTLGRLEQRVKSLMVKSFTSAYELFP